MTNKPHKIVIRNTCKKDISKIVAIQRESFPDVSTGMISEPSFLEDHISLFQQGQFCAELNGRIVGSASSLIVSLNPEYRDHTWHDIVGNHNILQIMIVKVTAFMEMIFVPILIFVD